MVFFKKKRSQSKGGAILVSVSRDVFDHDILAPHVTRERRDGGL